MKQVNLHHAGCPAVNSILKQAADRKAMDYVRGDVTPMVPYYVIKDMIKAHMIKMWWVMKRVDDETS